MGSHALLAIGIPIRRVLGIAHLFHTSPSNLGLQQECDCFFRSTSITTLASIHSWHRNRAEDVSWTGGLQVRTMASTHGLDRGHLGNDTRARIHILGIGNIGRLIAHGLAIEDRPPNMTLVLHRLSLAESWKTSGHVIEIITDGVSSKSGNYVLEVLNDAVQGEPIENLIVATKTINTASAILSIRHRLGPSSTILFAQNGMGVIDEVNDKIFPNVATRPRYLASVITHGAYSQGPFASVHAGFGTVAVGKVDHQNSGTDDSEQRDLVDAILRAPILAAREVSTNELFQLQIEKLAVNAIINPLTVIFNCRNGELLTNPKILQLMELLLDEISSVICSLPELRKDRNIRQCFSTTRLKSIVLDVAEKTSKNTSSMLQDVKARRRTEIDYINGYIVKRGNEVGVDCNHNQMLVRLVKETRTINIDEIQSYF